MAKVNKRSTGNKRGRPATGQDPVTAIRHPPEMTAGIDAWAEKRGVSRSQAIRQMVELALAAPVSRATPKGKH